MRAASRDDVVATMRWASATGTPVVPRGAGSGLSGAANAVDGCVVLCTERMDAVVEIDPADMLAVVQPGVVNGDLKRAVAAKGLFYAPDPGSQDFCSIGGNVATNAGGLCCVKYGVTRDAVLGLEVVLADGRLLRTGGRTVKDVAGLDLTRLFVGSEGMLGVVTEVTVRLLPARPAPCTVVARVRRPGGRRARGLERGGHDAAEHVRADGRRHDRRRRGLDAVRPRPVRRRAPAAADRRAGRVRRGGERCAATALRGGGRDLRDGDLRPRGGRHADDGAPQRRHRARGPRRLGARRRRRPAVGGARRWWPAAARSGIDHDVEVATFGHAGDGNMHPTVVYPRDDPAAQQRAAAAFQALLDLALDLGGTVTGEHGVGLAKRSHLARQVGEVHLDVQRAIKAALDPQGILNPGKSLG